MTQSEHLIKQNLIKQLLYEGKNCYERGSRLYGLLLNITAKDVAHEGPCWYALREHAMDSLESVLSLRFLRAIHLLVLRGLAPELSAYYPSVGGSIRDQGLHAAFLLTVKNNFNDLQQLIKENFVQTNDVGRSAALMGGFLRITRLTNLPLNLFEVGASAGFNLRWDCYFYQNGIFCWGDKESPVRFSNNFIEGYPFTQNHNAKILGRQGCDLNPLNPLLPEDCLALFSCIWADHTHRIDLFKSALNVSEKVPVLIDKDNALDWLSEKLNAFNTGEVIVVFHSIFIQYLSENEQKYFETIIQDAGKKATDRSPLAWLRMEPSIQENNHIDIKLTLWPSGTEECLGISDPYGRKIRWFYSDTDL